MKFLAIGFMAAGMLLGCVSAPTAPTAPASAPAPAPAPAPVATSPPPSSQPQPQQQQAAAASQQRYRCDQNIEFSVRFLDDSAELDAGARGNDVLLRDAGGVTPQQTVYSNPRLRAEFGLGTTGREAILRYLAPQLTAHCVKD